MHMHRRVIHSAVAAAAVVMVAAGCDGTTGVGSSGSPSSPPTGSPSRSSSATTADGLPAPVAQKVWAIGTKDGGSASSDGGPFLQASVYGVYRQGDEARLALGLTIVGEGSEGQTLRAVGLLARTHGDADDPSLYDSTGLTLVDLTARKAYLVARDAEGACLCSSSPDLASVATTVMKAQFAAPPSDATHIDVVVPKFGVLRDVPISEGMPPAQLDEERKPTSTSQPGVLVEELESDGPAVTAPVVDVDAPVANLDKSVTRRKGKVVLAADVLFDFNKWTLTGKAKARIAETAEILRRETEGPVQVNGYTDSKGSNAYNRRLSERRAAVVRAELAKQLRGSGITLVAKGYGESDPVAANTVDGKDSPKGRAQNRRVETVYRNGLESTPTPGPTDRSEPTANQTREPGAVPTPTKAYATRTVEVNGQRLVVEMYGIHRHGPLATLEFGVKAAPAGLKLRGLFARDSMLDDDVTGVDLVDRTHKKRYLPANYGKEPFCSSEFGRYHVNSGQTLYLSATYADPGEGVTKVDVTTPNTGTFKNVPVF